MQGLVRFGYGRMTSASYALVRVKNAAAAKAWLRAAPVTTAVAQKPPPTTALQIAFTAPGLRALGVPESVHGRLLARVSRRHERKKAARDGWATSEDNAPSSIGTWGGPGREPHRVVMFFAEPRTSSIRLSKAPAVRHLE